MGGMGGMGLGNPQNLAQMQQQLMSNPQLMEQMMNSPMVRQAMSNPDFIRSAITSNPEMRNIMDSNPEFAQAINSVLNDPAQLQQMLEAARNPSMQREMTRNMDRAMSNIENHPSGRGFDFLRQMYTNVQEPLLNSQQARNSNSNSNSNSSDSGVSPNIAAQEANPDPNTAPLPNPWSGAAGSSSSMRLDIH